MKRMTILLIILAVVLVGFVGCLYWSPMHTERPGTNREALGTTDPDPIDGLNREAILDGPDGTSTHAFRGSRQDNETSNDTIIIEEQ